MSPEQVRGQDVDKRTDVLGLRMCGLRNAHRAAARLPDRRGRTAWRPCSIASRTGRSCRRDTERNPCAARSLSAEGSRSTVARISAMRNSCSKSRQCLSAVAAGVRRAAAIARPDRGRRARGRGDGRRCHLARAPPGTCSGAAAHAGRNRAIFRRPDQRRDDDVHAGDFFRWSDARLGKRPASRQQQRWAAHRPRYRRIVAAACGRRGTSARPVLFTGRPMDRVLQQPARAHEDSGGRRHAVVDRALYRSCLPGCELGW